ncbi:MAG: hypothetical protein ACRDRS_03650 [Pseudonocardiaceae bacterium]
MAPGGSRDFRALAQRLSWGLADQAVSSMTNFIVGIYVARSLGATAFGIFSLAWVTYGVVLNISRGLATDPLMVRFSGAPTASWRDAVSRMSGTALLVGLVAGATSLLVGIVLRGPIGIAFVALGLILPAVLLQDSWRFAFFAAGQGQKAFTNDIVWGATLLPAMVVAAHGATVFGLMLAWGLSGAVAAAYGCFQIRLLPRLTGVRSWCREQRDLGPRYLIENVSTSGGSQLRMYGLGAIAGLAGVGTVRGAELLFGPFLAFMMGVSLVAVPEAVRVLQRSQRLLPLLCLLLSGTQALAAVAWGLALLFLLPYHVGWYALGSVWLSASALILPVMLAVMNSSFSAGAAAGLRALGASRRSLRAQLLVSAAYVTGGLIGAAMAGALGSSWGVALATAFGVAVWWLELRAGLRAPVAAPLAGPHVAVSTQANHEEMRNP